VPASVPSEVHNSICPGPGTAKNTSCPRATVSPEPRLSSAPGAMSLSSRVPSLVPSLRQTSLP
jgi:hypothetical protein